MGSIVLRVRGYEPVVMAAASRLLSFISSLFVSAAEVIIAVYSLSVSTFLYGSNEDRAAGDLGECGWCNGLLTAKLIGVLHFVVCALCKVAQCYLKE